MNIQRVMMVVAVMLGVLSPGATLLAADDDVGACHQYSFGGKQCNITTRSTCGGNPVVYYKFIVGGSCDD